MDNATLAITALFLGVGALPFYLSYANRKRQEKGLINALKEAVGDDQMNITRFEILGNRMLAFDPTLHRIYLTSGSSLAEIQTIDLTNVLGCKVNTVYARSTHTESPVNEIEKIVLVFEPKSGGTTPELVLYSKKHNGAMDGEIQIANTWSVQINAHIRSIINN